MVTELIRLTYFRSKEIKTNIDARLLDLIIFESLRCVVGDYAYDPTYLLNGGSAQTQITSLEYLINAMSDMDEEFDPSEEDCCNEAMELVNDRMEIIISELKLNNHQGVFVPLKGMFFKDEPDHTITPLYPSFSLSHINNQFMIMTY